MPVCCGITDNSGAVPRGVGLGGSLSLKTEGAGAAGKSRSLLGPEEELKNKDREEKSIYE